METDTKLHGNTKATREDWLKAARDILVSKGVGEVKILPLSGKLDVSRSSFYWCFKDRKDLLNALLADWEARNTQSIVDQCGLPSDSIAEAACNFFECFVLDGFFDHRLDFAVREWSRRDPSIRDKIDQADDARLKAVTEMFARHGYAAAEADARARILYFMQLGYHALDITEPMDQRMSRIDEYLKGFTGQAVDPQVIARFSKRAMSNS